VVKRRRLRVRRLPTAGHPLANVNCESAGRPAAEPTSMDKRQRRPGVGSMRMGLVRPQARASAAALAMSRDRLRCGIGEGMLAGATAASQAARARPVLRTCLRSGGDQEPNIQCHPLALHCTHADGLALDTGVWWCWASAPASENGKCYR
jgi:hypothetical protein